MGETTPNRTSDAATHYTQKPGVGHHKKIFLKLTHEGDLPPGAQSLCHQFVDYKEEIRRSCPTPGPRDPHPWTPSQPPANMGLP